MSRYPDRFRNALMYPHQITVRGELWFDGAKVGDIGFVDGQVDAERRSSVRRKLTAEIDPRITPKDAADYLTPYGSQIKAFRGIRYPDNTIQEYPIFFGRIDDIEFGRVTNRIRASDLGAYMTDARFEKPYTATRGITIVQQIRNIILDVLPTAVIDVTATSAALITTPATWDRERTEALDNLALTIGAEWFAGADGHFHVDPLPSTSSAEADWVVDSGDIGVLISSLMRLDRISVYNAVIVNGEPPDGQPPAYGVSRDVNPNSPTRWGGPFGKVPRFFASQFITTNTQAQNTANAMLADAIASIQGCRVECVVNPQIYGANVVAVSAGGSTEFDGMYFFDSFTIPLAPERSMTMVLSSVYVELPPEPGSTQVMFERAPLRLQEGIRWP